MVDSATFTNTNRRAVSCKSELIRTEFISDYSYLYIMNNKRSTVLPLIKKLVKEIDPKAEIILYGSRARGDERPDSDWDLLILVNSQEDLNNETKFRHKLFDLELELEESFSITVHNKNQWESKYWVTPLYKNITREGVRI